MQVYVKLNYILDEHTKLEFILSILVIQFIGDDLYDGFHPRIQTQSLQCYKVKFRHPIYNKEIEIILDYKNLEKYIKV